MTKFDVLIEQTESTVVSSYERKSKRQKEYQSESELEKEFIEDLRTIGYEYLDIKKHDDLVLNLRKQIEKLNDYKFTEKEWNVFLSSYLLNPNESITEKTFKIQEDNRYSLIKEDGMTQNIKIIDVKNIHNNYIQVINQVEVEGQRKNIYDVTILVNGLPLVHVELKRRGVSLKEAFNQIRRYSNESFWAESGLYEYAQIYVISNGTQTKYYSNTTREQAQKENTTTRGSKNKTSHSFEFTTFWADANNKIIEDLEDFTQTFFSKHTLLNIITKYCVFTSDKMLLVMRPYQIVATERIINQVEIGLNDKKRIGTVDAGGYVWHTTGSGKTLTSFKAARTISEHPQIKKVLFVVDRKDLDYQTMKEYDKFEEGSANSNISTAVLQRQLEDVNSRIIITTIQKLSNFVKQNKKHNLYNENVVLIFDEAHRSQFGEMHQMITKSFKKYFIFGFTGTPIFASNTPSGNKFPTMKTTEQVFGKQLHTYTIVDAIRDGNVLPFRIDYVNTVKSKDDIQDEDVYDITREETLLNNERIQLITEYILRNFDRKTKRETGFYEFNKLMNIKEVSNAGEQVEEIRRKSRIKGFNSMFATASIEAAKRYYLEFKKQQEHLYPDQKLKVATIFSWNPNEDNEFADSGLYDENNENIDGLDKSSRDFLDDAIKDYNEIFGMNYDTSSQGFQNYYKDVSLRMKNKEIDLLIVVNMFLTGFDATTLNTLWIDKNLRQHGLIQAFSRTNRILNSVKTFGNIVSFRNLENNVNDAIAIFGNKDAKGIVILKKFDEYYYGYDDFIGYKALVEKMLLDFPIGKIFETEEAEKEFIKLYNKILKVKNILTSFDDFLGQEIISDYDYQDYQSIYLGIYEKYRKTRKGDVISIDDDLTFELELVKSVEVNIDYILMMVEEFKDSNMKDKEILVNIEKAIDGSQSLRNKKDLILEFLDRVNVDGDIAEDWVSYINKKKENDLNLIIKEEGLNEYNTNRFMKQVFDTGEITDVGTEFSEMLPKITFFGGGDRKEKRSNVLEKLREYYDKYGNI